MAPLIVGILIVAAVATAGDYVWYETALDPHRWTTSPTTIAMMGVLHGAVLLTGVGGVLGSVAGRRWAGLPIGALSGIFGALVYYATMTAAGRSSSLIAMVLAWVALWIMMAVLNGRMLRQPHPQPWGEVLGRGAAAAIFGGLAFYFMVGALWGRMPTGERNYLLQFGAWAVAWAPGILSLGLPLSRPR